MIISGGWDYGGFSLSIFAIYNLLKMFLQNIFLQLRKGYF